MNSLQPQAGRRMFVFLLSPVCGRHGRFLCHVRRAPSRESRLLAFSSRETRRSSACSFMLLGL